MLGLKCFLVPLVLFRCVNVGFKGFQKNKDMDGNYLWNIYIYMYIYVLERERPSTLFIHKYNNILIGKSRAVLCNSFSPLLVYRLMSCSRRMMDACTSL